MNASMDHAAMGHDMSGMDHAAMGHDMSGMDHSAMGHDMSGMDHSAMGHDMGGMLHGGMVMTFHGGFKEQILFDFWETKTIGTFLLSCFALFVAAMLYEGLKLAREKLITMDLKRRANLLEERPSGIIPNAAGASHNEETQVLNMNNDCCATKNNNLINRNDDTNVVIKKYSSKLFSVGHLTQTALHMIQITVSYLLMLVFMTYNTWLCLAVVLGAGAGYFVFGIQRVTSIDVNEHCH